MTKQSKEQIFKWLEKNTSYDYYCDNKYQKDIKKLFRHTVMNCRDNVRE